MFHDLPLKPIRSSKKKNQNHTSSQGESGGTDGRRGHGALKISWRGRENHENYVAKFERSLNTQTLMDENPILENKIYDILSGLLLNMKQQPIVVVGARCS